MAHDVVLYAPNVHTGGGLVLLRALLAGWAAVDAPPMLILDARNKGRLDIPPGARVHWVEPRAMARLAGEFVARRWAGKGSVLFCFHGLPPLLPTRARVVVFLQNRNYLAGVSLRQFPIKTRLRLGFERTIGRVFRNRVHEYVVQTPTMRDNVMAWWGDSSLPPRVRIAPFLGEMAVFPDKETTRAKWDYVYVADGVAHKNHLRLAQAWKLLADQGIRPVLALTLGPRDNALAQRLLAYASEHGLCISNLGELSQVEVGQVYAESRAMVFPSLAESFGLPLVEAAAAGLPILAGELDYVRDVCNPAQTFDPMSSKSIARAVKRHLAYPDEVLRPVTVQEFWATLRQTDTQVRAG